MESYHVKTMIVSLKLKYTFKKHGLMPQIQEKKVNGCGSHLENPQPISLGAAVNQTIIDRLNTVQLSSIMAKKNGMTQNVITAITSYMRKK